MGSLYTMKVLKHLTGAGRLRGALAFGQRTPDTPCRDAEMRTFIERAQSRGVGSSELTSQS